MKEIIMDLHSKLNQFKGYEAGYSSRCDDSMIIDKDGKRYLITIEEIEKPSEEMLDDIKRYLR